MGESYDSMARDLKLKNLAIGTQTQYLTCCRRFAAYHMLSPRELGLDEVKEFLGQLAFVSGSCEAGTRSPWSWSSCPSSR